MKYKTILSELFTAIPETEIIIKEKMIAEEIDEEDGMHIIFSFVITPLLREWCSAEVETADRVFDFLEIMAHSADKDALEILDFSVLEPIADMKEPDRLIITKHMKAETLERFQYIRDRMFR